LRHREATLSDPAHSFQFGPAAGVTAAGPAQTVLGNLDTAASGGDPARALFATDLQALTALRSAAAGDGSTWIDGTDTASGLPTRYVAVGGNFLSLGTYVPESGRTTLAKGTASVSDYATIGFFYLTLLTGASGPQPQVTQVMTGSLDYAGEGLPDFATDDGLKELIQTIVEKTASFVAGVVEEALEVEGEVSGLAEAGTVAGQTAAEVAAGVSGPQTFIGPGGMTIEAEVGFGVGATVGFAIEFVAMLALLPLTLLAKEISAYVRVYNATGQEIDVTLCWIQPDNQSAGQLGNEPVTLPPLGPAWTPPWIIGEQAVHYVSWVVGNTDTLKGVAYVLRLDAVNDFPGGNVMVNIPNKGANSLAVTFDFDEDCEAVWTANKDQNTGLAASVTSGGYQLRIATNQTTGQSPAPADGTLGYQYEHVVIIDKAPAD
jgi:hypothetical protein